MLADAETCRQEGQEAATEKLDGATKSLACHVQNAHQAGRPVRRSQGVDHLVREGLPRKAARELMEGGLGSLWQVVGTGKRGDPELLVPPVSHNGTAQETGGSDALHSRSEAVSILAGLGGSGRQESITAAPADTAGANGHECAPGIENFQAGWDVVGGVRWPDA
jgi:hypothetical protein